MAKINLRPWREERAAARQKEFTTNLVAAALIAAALVFIAGYYYDIQKARQDKRNAYLQEQIAELDVKIKEIEELRSKRERLLERLKAIQSLQGNRPIIVRNFDELVRVMPDGLHYTKLARKEGGFTEQGQEAVLNDAIRIQGLTVQNKDVSELMRNLDKSIWFGEASFSKVISVVEKAPSKGKSNTNATGAREFDLTVPLDRPKAEEAK